MKLPYPNMSFFFNYYKRQLVNHPFLTNAISTGLIFGAGDVLAQSILSPKPSAIDNNDFNNNYDYARTMRSVIYGSCVWAPIGDKWFKFLAKSINLPAGYSMFSTKAVRVLVDQVTFAPLGIPLYFSVMSFMEGLSLKEVEMKIRGHWWETLKTHWCVWPMVQLVNFNYVPVRFQLLTVNVVCVLWMTFMSFKNSSGSSSSKIEKLGNDDFIGKDPVIA